MPPEISSAADALRKTEQCEHPQDLQDISKHLPVDMLRM
jgi:hypothetical protein